MKAQRRMARGAELSQSARKVMFMWEHLEREIANSHTLSQKPMQASNRQAAHEVCVGVWAINVSHSCESKPARELLPSCSKGSVRSNQHDAAGVQGPSRIRNFDNYFWRLYKRGNQVVYMIRHLGHRSRASCEERAQEGEGNIAEGALIRTFGGGAFKHEPKFL